MLTMFSLLTPMKMRIVCLNFLPYMEIDARRNRSPCTQLCLYCDCEARARLIRCMFKYTVRAHTENGLEKKKKKQPENRRDNSSTLMEYLMENWWCALFFFDMHTAVRWWWWRCCCCADVRWWCRGDVSFMPMNSLGFSFFTVFFRFVFLPFSFFLFRSNLVEPVRVE